jgi:hypothetical protein
LYIMGGEGETEVARSGRWEAGKMGRWEENRRMGEWEWGDGKSTGENRKRIGRWADGQMGREWGDM